MGLSDKLLQRGLALDATICCIAVMATAQEIANATGMTEAYGRMLLDGSRTPSLRTALTIYDSLGERLGPLRGLEVAEIETARKMAEAA